MFYFRLKMAIPQLHRIILQYDHDINLCKQNKIFNIFQDGGKIKRFENLKVKLFYMSRYFYFDTLLSMFCLS